MRHFWVRAAQNKILGYICLPSLLVLLFYWERLEAYFNGHELWLLLNHVYIDPPRLWRPVWAGLNNLLYVGFGLDPLPYRVVYVIPHICLLILLYLFWNRLLNNKALSIVVVLLFTSFYLNAEVIIVFTFHHELLMTTFTLAALVCFCYYRKTYSRKYYVFALFFAILAGFSKATAGIIPLLLLSIDCHISNGIFPLRLPPLKDIGRILLPQLPFFLVLSFIAWVDSHHGSIGGSGINCLLFFIPGVGTPFSQFMESSYWCIIYSLSPCFITDRLTIILAFSIVAGLVWLFYRSSSQRRSLIVTVVVCWGISLFPYISRSEGVVTRYLFLSSTFTMFLVALLAFETGLFLYKLLEERFKGFRLSPDNTAAFLALLILLPAIYFNYTYIRQFCQIAVQAGEITKEVVEGTIRILPQCPEKSQIIHINLPGLVTSKRPHCTILSEFGFYSAALDLYHRQQGIKLYWHDHNNTKAIFVNLGYSRVKLSSEAWYELWGSDVTTTTEEVYDLLSKDKNNKLLFFNPVSNKIIDVSGWSYKQLAESVYPYKDKLGL